MLGRPFGVPNDPPFQDSVLRAALRLLEAPSGPVLEDYAEDAPRTANDDHGSAQVCPVGFASNGHEQDTGVLFLREIQALAPWYDLARERRGRSSVGLSGVSIEEAARMLSSVSKGDSVRPAEGASLGQTLKLAAEDVRAYYYEAAAAQPGIPDAHAVEKWFWRDTVAGRVFLEFQKVSAASQDKSLQRLAATSIVPRGVLHDQSKA